MESSSSSSTIRGGYGMVKIGVTGTHSTGKTSSLLSAKRLLEAKGLRVGYVSEIARRCPLPILKQHTLESTLWIVTSTIAEELTQSYKSEVVLVDRPVLDAMAYYVAALEHRGEIPETNTIKSHVLYELVKEWSRSYDSVYRTVIDPKIPIADNGSRDTDSLFRSSVARALENVLERFRPDAVLLSSDEKHNAELIYTLVTNRLNAGK